MTKGANTEISYAHGKQLEFWLKMPFETFRVDFHLDHESFYTRLIEMGDGANSSSIFSFLASSKALFRHWERKIDQDVKE